MRPDYRYRLYCRHKDYEPDDGDDGWRTVFEYSDGKEALWRARGLCLDGYITKLEIFLAKDYASTAV